ncbi:MAG: hypothetical protein QG584_2049 [Pseudomonadota bacterium]|nr:hypothetical protein [Pseudomonadota bacterium]
MAGSISLSLSQQFDEYGKPLSGGLLYTIQAGTTATPQNAFKDYGLSIVHPNPIILDAAGRVPAFYLADGQIKIRLTDKNGVDQIVQDNLLVIGPSSGGGGGGGGVDATTVMATGDIKARYGTGALAGFVRLNGRTIGSAVSGANERANIDCGPLFQYLWGADTSLTVSGGRGASAVADWLANKTLTLPDARNRVFAGLGDMGNSDAGLFAGLSFSKGDGVTLGSILAGTVTLATENLPPYTPSGSLSAARWSGPTGRTKFAVTTVGGAGYSGESVFWTGSQDIDLSVQSTFTGTAQGGTSTPVKVAQPTILMTIYIKL